MAVIPRADPQVSRWTGGAGRRLAAGSVLAITTLSMAACGGGQPVAAPTTVTAVSTIAAATTVTVMHTKVVTSVRESATTVTDKITESLTATVTETAAAPAPTPPADAPPPQEPPASDAGVFGEGVNLVGTTVQPGTYSAPGGSLCYWARLSGTSRELDDIITNGGFTTGQVVTIDATDAAFESNGCGLWTKIG